MGSLAALAAACGDVLPILTLTSPVHGTFTTASSISVTGTVTQAAIADLEVTVNGVVTPLVTGGAFSTSVAVSSSAVLNPVLVRVRKISTGYVTLERVMVIAGPSVSDGMYSDNGIGMRINDTGLDQLQPTIQGLINGSFDVQALILAANPIVNDYCVINIFGCISSVDVNATSVTYTQPVGVNLDAISGATNVSVGVNDIRVNYRVSGSFSCNGRITANTTTVAGNYDQVPGSPANTVDVNQQGNVSVGFTNFDNEFTSGICDFPLIGDIIQLIIGDVQPMVRDGLVTNLGDPDGSGPADAPIAAAIQATLAGLSIAGPVGEALGVELDADFDQISEDTAGLTYRIDSRIMRLDPPVSGAPDLLSSANPTVAFPGFGASAPNGQPYGLGLALSPGTFNQLLKAETEGGLLQTEITEFQGIPLTAGVLALFLPEFGSFNPYYPMKIRVMPTLAPFTTASNGLGGEQLDLRVPHVIATIIGQDGLGAEIEFLRVAFDARIGLNFSYDSQTASLVPAFGPVVPSDIQVAVLQAVNPTTEATLQSFLPQVIALVLPDLGSSLGSFPIPSFLGLNLDLVQLTEVNEYLALYLNLVP
jgi:hypothetical protein